MPRNYVSQNELPPKQVTAADEKTLQKLHLTPSVHFLLVFWNVPRRHLSMQSVARKRIKPGALPRV